MARKGENIYKRKDGRWEGRYIKGRKLDGKINYGYVYARTYKEVREKLTLKKNQLFSVPENHVPFKGSVEDWFIYWFEELVAPNVKISTLNSYKSKTETHILPAIGAIPLQKLTTQHLNNLVKELANTLSVHSVHAVFRVLKTSLHCAAKENYIREDVYKAVVLPRAKKQKIETLTKFEHKLLVKETKKHKNGLPALIALETGMRIGEIAGLKWKDIDFIHRTISVKRTLQRIAVQTKEGKKTKIIEGKPKSETSERVIPLSDSLFFHLMEEKRRSKAEYVISKNGECVEPRMIRIRFKCLLKEKNLKSCSFHALRHSFATRCLEKGVNIAVISSLLGHASTKMTLDTYINSDITEEREAIERVSSM